MLRRRILDPKKEGGNGDKAIGGRSTHQQV